MVILLPRVWLGATAGKCLDHYFKPVARHALPDLKVITQIIAPRTAANTEVETSHPKRGPYNISHWQVFM